MKREDTKTKVIEGFVNPKHSTKYDEEVRLELPHADFVQHQDHVRATLVIGERGVAESEVKAMLEEIKDQTLSTAFDKKVDAIAAKYNITL